MPDSGAIRQVGDRIEALLQEIRGLVIPRVQERVDELVRLLVEVYGASLKAVVEVAAESEGGLQALERRLAEDPLLASVLLLHDLHPVELEIRVHRALEKVRPYLGSHAGGVKLLGVDSTGVVRLKLEGSCDGCPSSTMTVKLAIEEAIRAAAPDVTHIEVEGVADPSTKASTLVQIGQAPEVTARNGDGGVGDARWTPLDGSSQLAPGQVSALELRGARILLCRLGETLYAYRNACTACGSTLDGGVLDDALLSCPGCRQHFEIRLAGRSVEDRRIHLDPVPLLGGPGDARIALPDRAP